MGSRPLIQVGGCSELFVTAENTAVADKVVLECCMAALCAYYRAQKLGGIAMEVLEFHFQQNHTV